MQKLTKEQAIVITGYTGFNAGYWDEFLKDLEKRIGYPVFTHQLADESFAKTVRDLYRLDFIRMCGD
jgi:hypothetical protein